MFISNAINVLSDPEWLLDLSLLVDITAYLNLLKTKLQCRGLILRKAVDLFMHLKQNLNSGHYNSKKDYMIISNI